MKILTQALMLAIVAAPAWAEQAAPDAAKTRILVASPLDQTWLGSFDSGDQQRTAYAFTSFDDSSLRIGYAVDQSRAGLSDGFQRAVLPEYLPPEPQPAENAAHRPFTKTRFWDNWLKGASVLDVGDDPSDSRRDEKIWSIKLRANSITLRAGREF